MCFGVVLSVDGWIVPLFGMLGLFFRRPFADDDDMAFGIELGTCNASTFRRRRFRAVCRFLLWIYAFHGRPVAAVFEEVLGPVDEVGEFGKARLVMTSARQSAAASTRPLMTRTF